MIEGNRLEPLAIDTKEAARLCSISERHFINLDEEGLLGPRAVRLKSSVRWVLSELREWLNAGCPNREKWDQRKAEDRSAA